MRPIPQMLRLVLLVGCLDMAVAMAGEEACDGPYKGRTPTPEELETVLRNHRAWLEAGHPRGDKRIANLCGANLGMANLRKARLDEANLQGANLLMANLQGANLGRANLQQANLLGANLQRVNLLEANLQEADLAVANLAKAIYEPYPEKLPVLWRLTNPTNELEKLVFFNTPTALIALREAFKKAGMRTQERQLTYAIERTKQLHAWDPSWYDPKGKDTRPWLAKLAGKSESLFSYVLFELPSGYGMAPSRALAGLGLLIVLFSVPYMIAVTTRGAAGIWMVWLPDRVHKAEGEANPVRVTSAFFFPPLKMWAARRWRRGPACGLSVLLIGLYFSLLSAFSLGWRELNVGTWIARVQPREYVLRATGWVRTVAGIQSLLSVYLLALWVLTYFGRPFE
jgi:Pentapeptide repeats (8 copies)